MKSLKYFCLWISYNALQKRKSHTGTYALEITEKTARVTAVNFLQIDRQTDRQTDRQIDGQQDQDISFLLHDQSQADDSEIKEVRTLRLYQHTQAQTVTACTSAFLWETSVFS